MFVIQTESSDRDAVGWFAAEHAQGELADALHRARLTVEAAADDAVIHRGIDPAVGWRVGRCCNPVEVSSGWNFSPAPSWLTRTIVDGGVLGQCSTDASSSSLVGSPDK